MAIKKTVTHYAKTVNGQPNLNSSYADYRNNWFDCEKASANTPTVAPQGNGHSLFGNFYVQDPKTAKEKLTKFKPWTLTGHDFQFSELDIPDNACITNITFKARLKVTGNITVKAPFARFNMYHGTKSVETYTVDDTGWDEGYYYYNPDTKLKNTWTTYTYTMSGDNFRKRGYPVKELRDSRMGIDLRWYTQTKEGNTDNEVYVKWVSCTVDYVLPEHILTLDKITSPDNPHVIVAGDEYSVKITHKNNSCSEDTDRIIQLSLPPNTIIKSYTGSNFNRNTLKWTVSGKANSNQVLKLNLETYTLGAGTINFKENVPTGGKSPITPANYYIYIIPSLDDVGNVGVYPQEFHKGHRSCVEFKAKVLSSDGEVTFNVNLDTTNHSATNVRWDIVDDITTDGVSFKNSTDTSITFTVPVNEVVDITFKGCYVPMIEGDTTATITFDNEQSSAPYTVLPPYTYVFSNKDKQDEDICSMIVDTDVTKVYTHRVVTSTEIGATIITCGVADYDGLMETSDCNLKAHIWEKINYIGVVPLRFSHFDPKSTFENKLINQSYKNKVYMGKEGVIDEDITLNIRVPPRDVTTLQGLVELDKPTPINANWTCFEGDALNHRGWVELTKITAEKTNPLYYKCELDVKYITHDIHTKFSIIRGKKIETANMPEILSETFGGGNLATALNVFDIDTDGGYIYDDESEDGVGNLFSLDEGQHLSIKTINPLANVTELIFDWYSNKIREDRENNLSRIFRLRDVSTGKIVFEYEYTNFQFNDDFVTCDTIRRVLTDTEGYTTDVNESIDLKTEIEADPIIIDTDEEEDFSDIDLTDDTTDDDSSDDDYDEINDDAYEEGYIAPTFDPTQYVINTVYGSSLQFRLNQNKLSIVDEGFNGREVSVADIPLQGTSYKFETLWTNNNEDGMTEDLVSYIDIELNETVLATNYADFYGKLVVSPFPVPKKKVVFTRESEEGTIYYMEDDGLPFKYMLEPFYQYHCGTDLVTREGISLVNLNNSYSRFYIENGLVRLGFNKYNGELYLAKYDVISKEWVTTHYFKMRDDITFSLGSLSDDKIVIKAGDDTYFTIWRGHPYIAVSNPTDIIYFDDKFSYAYSDKVNGEEYTYPMVFSFLNTDNLLLSCIGGKSLDDDCITVDDDYEVGEIDIAIDPSDSYIATENSTLSVITSATNGTVFYLIDGVEVGSAENPYDLTHKFEKEGEYTIQAVIIDDNDNIGISKEEVIKVGQRTTVINPPKQPEIKGAYKLKIIEHPDKFTYHDGKKVVLKLTRGGTPIRDMVIELQYPDAHTITKKTDANGLVEIVNNSVKYVPGKYQWGGRLYNWQDDDGDGKLVYEALKWITIEKATPTYVHNAPDGKVNLGKHFIVKLKGVAGGLDGKKITYTVNGGSKKTKTTNDKGNIHFAPSKVGTYKYVLNFAGSTRYNGLKKTFTIKVVK